MNTPNHGAHPTPADDGIGARLAPDRAAAEKAALESVSSTLLMPGENPSTRYLEDAEHWIAVYSELYNFTVSIVDRFSSGMAELQAPAQEYLRSHDMLVHEKQIQRFAARLAFWRQRAGELGGAADRSGKAGLRQVKPD